MPKNRYKTVKKSAKAQGRATRSTAKRTGTSIKRGTKTAAKGERQYPKARAKQSKQTSKGKTVTTRARQRTADAAVKIKSGRATAASPAPGKKPRKKAYRTTPNIEYGKTPGAKKYLSMRGKPTSKRGGRPKS